MPAAPALPPTLPPAGAPALLPPAGAPALLQLAGAPALLRDGRPLRLGSRKALVLAVLLALQPGARRTWVSELLWPDQDAASARRNLRRDLFRLRQAGLEAVDESGEALRLGPLVLAWPGPEVVAPRWLDGLDELAGAELQDWVQQQRTQLHRRWAEQVGEALAEAPSPAPAA
ncbi:MAG: hypothetical protein JNM08_14160, partial [Rubrivivax sp.]|nr:hypothetical protein [Rubrivivax sp.]